MLLFVKKQFADALRSGDKKFELRADVSRYRGVQPGRILSVNGRDKYAVVSVHRFETVRDCLDALTPKACGFKSIAECESVWSSLYPDEPAILAWELERYLNV